MNREIENVAIEPYEGRKNIDISPVGDSVATTLEQIFGNKVRIVLLVSDPSNGEVTSTTNMPEEEMASFIVWLAMQHMEGRFTMEEGVSKQ